MDLNDGLLGVNSATQVYHVWNNKQLELIEAHRNYYMEMLDFLEDIENEGPHEKNFTEET